MRALAVLLALALAGCLGGTPADEAPAPEPVEEEPETTREPVVFTGTAQITASGVIFALGGPALDFQVDEGATIVHAEVRWDDPVQDINLALSSPRAGETGGARNYDHVAHGGAPGAPDSPHSLTVPAPAAGGWQASAFANGAAAFVEYEMAVTVFYSEDEVPGGYSAFG